jgi:hypothetical protein
MKKVLEIQEFEEKKTNAGKPYVRYKTSEGWMSCFDSKSNEKLQNLKGYSVNVEVIESGEFKNIRKFYSPASESDDVEVEKPKKVAENGLKQEFPTSMKVAYAKDVFCAVCSRISQSEFDGMDENERLELAELAIKVIKKIESAF